jgi:hypothetical protein
MKKCSTAGWDKVARKPNVCPYVYWLKSSEYEQKSDSGGEAFLPHHPQD